MQCPPPAVGSQATMPYGEDDQLVKVADGKYDAEMFRAIAGGV